MKKVKISVDEEAKTVLVSEFEIDDSEIFAFLAGMPADERSDAFLAALKAGAIALRSIRTTERVDYVEKCFNSLMNDFDRNIEDVFGDRGQLASLIEDHFGEDGRIVKQLLDPDLKGTPLNRMKESMESRILELRKDLGIADVTEEIAKKTTLKGMGFEDRFMELVCSIARPLSDIVEKTGTVPGLILNSKKGDFVSKICNRDDLRIVFETKDTARMGIQAIESDMKEALQNRGAVYGVFVSNAL